MFLCDRGSSETIHRNTHTQFTNEVGVSNDSVSEPTCLYQLVSVVEHYGRADTEVHSVSEETVLSAEASMLFYEKIPEN
ncbi:hypothetical protein K1719_020363 [Acacia pycnantha]|nr:hypothetical protein K1719_020363 [Acacia pycnantha]